MKIHFNGAAQTVTGTQFHIEANGANILLDCGLYQGKRSDFYAYNQVFNFDPRKMDALLLSHAHIDHSGNIPNLVKQGFNNPIYATRATCELADVMLRDSAHIQESDIAYVNKKRARKGQSRLEPLYTAPDAIQATHLFQPQEYGQSFQPVEGITAKFVEAGHILGSAAIVLDINENGKKTRIWFSGDIGREKLPLLRDPVLPTDTQILIMESTYGDKPHRSPEAAFIEFRDIVIKTVARGGKVIIPAFAVGRTQELVYFLNIMLANKDIPAIPIYVDSPLAVNASDIFRKFSYLFDEETKKFVESGNHKALSYPNLTYVRSVIESKALNDRYEAMVIISASGMAESGRILHHLRNNIENPKNTIMIVSWQAPNTLGRRMAERQKVVRIFGQLFEVNAEIATIGGLSAHAGQDMLVKYALNSQASINNIFLVHGEHEAATALKEKLNQHGLTSVSYPQKNQTVEI
ncbi:MAG: MBL fold metallo-hydrolase [Chloroflexi bacterium 44-23]|nr:MAG: MBL fold metallo-hydrolase [Chloroflexi bacterium 44-23]